MAATDKTPKRAAGGRKTAAKAGAGAKKAAGKEKMPGQDTGQGISPELQSQLDATQELNPAARGGRKS